MENRRERERPRYRRGMAAEAMAEIHRRMRMEQPEAKAQASTPRIPKAEMDNDLRFDPNLSYREGSPIEKELQAESRRVVEAIEQSPRLKELRGPIASGPSREKRSWLCVATLLANLHKMQGKGKDTLALTLNPAKYSRTRIGAGIINLVRLMDHTGLLTVAKGFRNASVPQDSRLTRIQPTEKLKGLLACDVRLDEALDRKRQDLVELRETVITPVSKYRTKKTKPIVPRDVWIKKVSPEKRDEALEREHLLAYYNLVCRDYRITVKKKGAEHRTRLNVDMHCVYSDGFTTHGRFYTGAEGHQRLSKEERETIRINGHPTIEYDFDGYHIRMLYAIAGQSYPLDKDPYMEVLRVMDKDPEDIRERFPSIRDDLKTMLLALVNGKVVNKRTKEQTALRRADYRLFTRWKDEKNPEKRSKLRRECGERQAVWKAAGILDRRGRAKDVLQAFYKAHAPIRKYFNGGCPHDLLYIDQQICDYVLREMTFRERPIPVLPIHDSFRTFDTPGFRRELKATMKMVYEGIMQRVTGRPKVRFEIHVRPVHIKSKNQPSL